VGERRGKLSGELVRTLRQSKADSFIPIIVRYREPRRIMRHREPMRGLREGYHYRLRPFAHMHATPEAIKRLEKDPEILEIFEDKPVYAYLDTSVPHIQAPRVWAEGFTGEGVRIAIIDTGIDPDHPDFQGRIAETTDFTGEGPVDHNGHGTHCASIAAGSGAASGGLYRGVAPGATIYSAKVLRSNGEGMMSDVAAGIEWAVDRQVQVISLSLGGQGPCDGTDFLCETCEAAIERGITVCVAAGNDGPSAYTVGSPGCAHNVITVGAANDTDHIASFSSRGPTSDGRVKPDIVLPGVNIIAARAKGTSLGKVIDDYYVALSGTSMATPHAAGICALLLQAEPDLTPLEIKQRLMGTAIDLGEDPYSQGQGRADAWLARHGEPTPAPEPTPPAPSPSPGQGCLPVVVQVLLWGFKRKPPR